ncbi:olfactory receptor 6C74-like [Silurus meridionalis]|uniref:olfactory receptor 6C74-like n=1 Tax=Silurus meridionalis TaxID=175797 RepID=UPI001EE9DA7C|nr:olfactory receptor 6C74-like [Silurus meridionalis]
MSYDRYAAICYPLHYHDMMSTKKLQHFPYVFRTFMSLYFMMFPPLFNPIIYGISGQVIKKHIKKISCVNKIAIMKK